MQNEYLKQVICRGANHVSLDLSDLQVYLWTALLSTPQNTTLFLAYGGLHKFCVAFHNTT